MKQKYFILPFLVIIVGFANAQYTDRYWAFGEKAALDFKNVNSPVADSSILHVRGTCASICDSIGNLLFYAGSPNIAYFKPPSLVRTQGYLINNSHQIILNGDSLRTTGWYQEMTIVPNPGYPNQFYIFQCGVTTSTNPGFSYSLVDMSLNNGFGYVIQKNVVLSTLPFTDAVVACQHGNGRDWWVVAKPWDTTTPVNSYYVYLVSPSGVSSPIIQPIGTTSVNSNGSTLKFSKDGAKLFIASRNNMIESYEFDRCTGTLSNPLTINPVYTSGPSYFFDGMEVSADASKMYLSSIYGGTNQDTSIVIQLDLNSPSIMLQADTIATFHKTNHVGPNSGSLQRGPDDKIYLSCFYDIVDCGYNYIYCDTSSFFTENMNLSVINNPNNLGNACNMQLFSQYLGGRRCYWGLPNNPNYELGKLQGSLCDTLSVGLESQIPQHAELLVWYNDEWQKAFLNAKNLKGRSVQLEIFNLNGQLIDGDFNSTVFEGFYTKGLDMSTYATGCYIVKLSTEKEVLTERIIKE